MHGEAVFSRYRGAPGHGWRRSHGLPTLSQHHCHYHYHCECHHRYHFMHIGACVDSEGRAEQAALRTQTCETREDRRNLKQMQPTAGHTEALKANTQQQGTQTQQPPAPRDNTDTPTIFGTNLNESVKDVLRLA
jgi:hypothetical protein